MNELTLKHSDVQGVEINNIYLPIREYRNQRVITFKDIDTVHERPTGTARKRFNDNKDRFIEGEDFYVINQPSEIRTLGFTRPQGGTPENIILVTESGYLMLVKSFSDDLAWVIQRGLVNSYFRAKDVHKALMMLSEKVIALENRIETKTPTKPDYWRWKSSVVTPMMKNLAQKLNCDVQDAFNVVYDNMTAKYGFNRSFAINQMCCKYNTSVESVIDAIADCPEYQRWFFETANDMLQDNINTQFSPTISMPVTVEHIDLDKVQRVIQPLIEKYADTSPHGTVTYKRVYKVMHKTNRAWKAVMTRNRYKSRKDVLMNNNSYFKDFTQAVNTLLAESEVTTK